RYISEEKRNPQTLSAVHLLLGTAGADVTAAVTRGQRVAAAIMRARDLVNEPAAVMTPSRLAAVAREVAEQNQLQITVYGPRECRDRGMGLFLAVAQGSAE